MEICYPTQNYRNLFLNKLCYKYPFLHKKVIGTSLCDRSINAYFIGNTKRMNLLCGGFHGSEYLTVMAMMRFIEDISESMANNDELCGFRFDILFKNRGVCIVPCINPDGTEIAICGGKSAPKYQKLIDSIADDTSNWQANARGVDINHNFNAGWNELKKLEIKNGITKPAKTRYGGEYPESEPESYAIAEFSRNNHFFNAFAFHSQGREIYFDYGTNTPAKSEQIAQSLAKSSGYIVSEPEGLAVGGGFKDWFIEKLHRPAFTIEIGLGQNPLPLSDFKTEYDIICEMLCLCSVL